MRKLLFICLSLCFYCSCKGGTTDQKEMKSSEIIKLVKSGKPVQIVDKIIIDDLNFTTAKEPYLVNSGMLQTEIASNIFFSNCVFMGKVSTVGKKETLPVYTCFKNNVVFTNCDFRGEVNLNNATILGMLNFSKSTFRENTNFDNLAVWAKDSYFSEIKTEKKFSMIYASFLGNLYFIDGQLGGNSSFQETSVQGKLSFNNAVFKQRAGFDMMEVQNSAFFNYTTFEKGADFSNSRFMNTVDFIKTVFTDKGNFEKTFFANTVHFENVNTTQDIILNDTYFGNKKTEN